VSQVLDDKEVLKSKRPDRLKNVEAPLRDQIPRKLLATLRDQQLTQKIDKAMNLGDSDRAEWLERQKEYLSDWDEFLEATAEGPFEGSSNLHIPMTLIVCRALHARFLQALLGVDPYFSLKARTEGMMDRAAVVSDVLSYALKSWSNHYQGVEATIDAFVWNWITTGSGLLKQRWGCVYESFVDVIDEEVEATPQYDGKTNSLIPRKAKRGVEKRVTKKVFEGPVFEVVNAEDVLIIGSADGDPQLADSVHHTQSLTASELWTLADQEIFDEDAVEKIIAAGPDQKVGRAGTDIKADRARNAGTSQVDTEADLSRYEIVESYLQHDVDGSGINSRIVVWWHRKTRELLRATYLRRINKSGEVPIYKVDFHKRPGQTYGVGAPEMMHPIAKELDAMHNIRIDAGMITNVPMFFYRPTSSINPETISFEPGAGIPVDDPQRDVNIPQWGNKAAFFGAEEQSLLAFIQRLFGISDLNLGVMSGDQGATRTASGVRALLGESNANLDVFLRRLNRGWTQALRGLLHMLQQRIPAGLSFRVTGETGQDYWRQIRSAEDLAGDFDIELSANTANSNKAIQMEMAQQIYQLTANPLDYQLGIVTPAQRYEAIKNLLKQMGAKDYARYVAPPQGYTYVPTPSEEINRVIRGIETPVAPNADHQGFMAAFQEIVDSDELLGQLTTEQTISLKAQADKHMQMMQAMAAQAAQVSNIQQQSVNAQAGAPLAANPAANPMSAGAMAQGVGEAPAA
jgi:hypothetical protein